MQRVGQAVPRGWRAPDCARCRGLRGCIHQPFRLKEPSRVFDRNASRQPRARVPLDERNRGLSDRYPADDSLAIVVNDENADSFELVVTAQEALDVFEHPYAYAAFRGLELAEAPLEATA